MTYTADGGAYLFLYTTADDGPAHSDDRYGSLKDARAVAFAAYGIEDSDWHAIEDPAPGCQHDCIARVRVKRNAADEPLWGQFERLGDSGWTDCPFDLDAFMRAYD